MFDDYSGYLSVDGKVAELGICDTSGQEDYTRLRPLSYPGTDVFILCFSIAKRESCLFILFSVSCPLCFPLLHHDFHIIVSTCIAVKHISTVWVPELSHHLLDVPVILVGTGDDDTFAERKQSQNTKSSTYVAFEEGLAKGKEIGACRYLECNLKSLPAVTQVFYDAVRATRGVLLNVHENDNPSDELMS